MVKTKMGIKIANIHQVSKIREELTPSCFPTAFLWSSSASKIIEFPNISGLNHIFSKIKDLQNIFSNIKDLQNIFSFEK